MSSRFFFLQIIIKIFVCATAKPMELVVKGKFATLCVSFEFRYYRLKLVFVRIKLYLIINFRLILKFLSIITFFLQPSPARMFFKVVIIYLCIVCAIRFSYHQINNIYFGCAFLKMEITLNIFNGIIKLTSLFLYIISNDSFLKFSAKKKQ